MPRSSIGSVAQGTREVAYGQRDVEDLLPLTLSRPQEALVRARAVLAAGPDLRGASSCGSSETATRRSANCGAPCAWRAEAVLSIARPTCWPPSESPSSMGGGPMLGWLRS